MFKTCTAVVLCLSLLASNGFADDASDFRSALQVTFPSTVAVQPLGAADQQQNINPLQQWQRGGLQPQWFPMPGQGLPMPGQASTLRAGFAIDANHILTQLFGSTDELTITTNDNTQHDAKVIARDNVTGLCIAKVDGVDLVSLVIGEGYPAPGLPVITTWIDQGVQRSKAGMISSPLNSSQAQLGMTQHVDFGSRLSVAGSPIVDSSGVLVGVTAEAEDGSVVCLPATQLSRLIDTGLADEPKDLERGLLGIAFSSDRGSVVETVTKGSPAEKGGMVEGDQILQIGNHVVRSPSDVIAAVAMARAGDSVEVTVLREGNKLTRELTLDQHPQQRITLAPLPGDIENGDPANGGAIVRQQGWQLKDGKLVPMDLDADGNFDMVFPKEFEEMFKNGPNALPNQFRIPRRFQGLRVERSDTEEAIRKLESERDQQAAKIKELTEKIEELEKKK